MDTVRVGTRADGPPTFALAPRPGELPVAVWRIDHAAPTPGRTMAHAHDFPMLVYSADARGTVPAGGRDRQIGAGDLFVVAPGDVLGPFDVAHPVTGEGWAVSFTAEALGPDAPGSALAWRAHPLLFPFVRRPGVRDAAAHGAARRPSGVDGTGRGAGRGAVRAGRRLPRGRAGAPDADARGGGPARRRRGRRPAGEPGAAAGRRVRGDRAPLPGGAVAAGRGAGGAPVGGPPHHGGAAAHRPHGAGVDRGPPDGGGPPAARRVGPVGRGDRQARGLSRPGLLRPGVRAGARGESDPVAERG